MKKQRSVYIYDESNDSILLRNSLIQLVRSSRFEEFDYFLINKWAGIENESSFEELNDEEIMPLRKRAYRNFNKAIKGKKVANCRTIRKWFGIDGFAIPKREALFRLAFALGLTTVETSDYLVNGMLAPSFQINDYIELIYMYGLDNSLTYEDCTRMIDVYEKNAHYDTEYIQGNHTTQLWEMYEINKKCMPEEFLGWMLQHEVVFKGYSKTVLDCFIKLTDDIQECIKSDAREYLHELVTENGYCEWKKSGCRNGDMKELVPGFLRRFLGHDKDKEKVKLVKSMKNAYTLAYGESRNTNIVKNIYMHETLLNSISGMEDFVNKTIGISFSSRTDKYMSQILSVSVQKSYQMQLRIILSYLGELDDNATCPEEIVNLLEEHGVVMTKCKNVGSCLRKVNSLLTNQTQNCELIGRDDILPLVHYLSQRQYANMMREDNVSYDMEQARNHFENLANAILNRCQMALISPEYRLDYLMLSSYCKEDMYSLVEMMEAIADFGRMTDAGR